MLRNTEISMGSLPHFVTVLPPSLRPEAPPSEERSSSSSFSTLAVTKSFTSSVVRRRSTQDVTTSTLETDCSPPQLPTRCRSFVVCQMYYGDRQHYCGRQPIAACTSNAAPERHPDRDAADSTGSDDTISSHEGSFYASLRLEQKFQQQQQQQRRRKRAARRTPPTPAFYAASGRSSESSFRPDIISFGFSPPSSTPTTTTLTAGNAWSVSTGRKSPSPFAASIQGSPCQSPMLQPPRAYRSFRPASLNGPSEQDRVLPAVSVRPHPSCNSSGRSAKSIMSSGPRTPQEFLAWRKELVELRKENKEERRMAQSCGSELVSLKKTGGNADPLHSDAVDCFLRSCPSGDYVRRFVAPLPAANRARNPGGSVSPRSSAILKAEAHCRCRRIPPSPRDPFSTSATTPYEQRSHPYLKQVASSDSSPFVSRQSSSIQAFPVHAVDNGAAEMFTDCTHRTVETAAMVKAELPRRNRERWNAGEVVALAIVLVATFTYVLNEFFFIDLTYLFLW
ncbi:hypothetical protein ABL78_3420 [Leptomonas seymouri]|uniref:Transmembrane protein n=1 Tax=Leptomonas seymouri TaxID=5684 RepID=A0A0N0P6D8_LEPSE|nr:hypothetical protein ABL78_3420 [Leptomonas seymouri]|eukprot:KPI87509.1 hypothetical protein ABL78_3420 [Leptomonas seymouri]